MPLVINNNIPSLTAQRNISQTNVRNSRTLERLSSGLRINRAGDDAAGLAISEKLRSQVRGLNQAVRNANDGISLIQTAEGAINTATNIVQRLRELAVQAASDTNTAADRAALKKESDALVAEITRIGNTTEFNGKALLNGSFNSGKLHIGANFKQSISFSIGEVRAGALGRRATVTGNLSDGAVNGVNATLTPGEVTVNGERVVANTNDDQVSALEIIATGVLASGAITSGQFRINSTVIGSIGSFGSVRSKVSAIISQINAASITNITARAFSNGSGFVLVAKNGTDITLHASGATVSTVVSRLGIAFSHIGSRTDVTTFNGTSSALAKAAAINAVRSATNVTAIAQTTTVTGSAAIAAGTIANNGLFINGVNIGNVSVQASDASGTLVAAINGKTAETGVVASVDSNGALVLTAEDGRNISVTGNAAALTVTKLTNTITRSTVQLDSVDPITLAGSNVADLGSDSSGSTLTATTFQPTLANALNTLDISTQTGADNGIIALDAALAQLNNQRAELGALQNRLELTVDNLATTSENLSASESRIRDADFAAETAQFTRNQILLQAGTAILAQANTLPQLALQLLG